MFILITGTTGIAEATASLARERGHEVFLAGLPEFDLTEPGAAERALACCRDSRERIDALFNVAGASGRRHGDGPLDSCTDEGWEFTIAANLTTTFRMTRAALRQMLAQAPTANGIRGTILNMSSVLAAAPEPEHFTTHAYAACKGAVESMTRSLAAWGLAHGIRANAIAPGLTRTPMAARAQTDPEILELMKTKQPLKKDLLDPSDIAKTALFLMSDESAMITGQVVTVDGGWTLA